MRTRRPLGPVTRLREVEDPTVRLFLFHHAGGSHLLYRGWTRHFPKDWDVCLLDAPGRGNAQALPLVDDCRRLAELLGKAITPLLDRPFAFFGHSMGALVAYAVTHRLLEAGRPLPMWLGVSSFRPPVPGAGSAVPSRSLLSDDALRTWLRTTGSAPERLLTDDVLWQAFAPILRNDLRLADTWDPDIPRPVLRVPLTVFGGRDDTAVPPGRLADWKRVSDTFLGTRLYSGAHFYLTEHREELCARITETMLARLVTVSAPIQLGTTRTVTAGSAPVTAGTASAATQPFGTGRSLRRQLTTGHAGFAATLPLQEQLLALTPDPVRGQVQGVESAGRMTRQGPSALERPRRHDHRTDRPRASPPHPADRPLPAGRFPPRARCGPGRRGRRRGGSEAEGGGFMSNSTRPRGSRESGTAGTGPASRPR